jgi:hypothetical protein
MAIDIFVRGESLGVVEIDGVSVVVRISNGGVKADAATAIWRG